jgi:hypothetical protein
MSVREDAKKNLELAGLFDADADYGGAIAKAVMKLVETHCDEGHSGMSSSYTLALFNKVIEGKALTAKYWDFKKAELEEMAKQNGFQPWTNDQFVKVLGERPG